MKKNLDLKKISSEINENGYAVIEKFYDDEDLDYNKKSLLLTLNYINPSNEEDLQKKYYEIKNLNPKLKSNFYDLMPYNINMVKMIHNEQILKLIKFFFKSEVLFSGRPAIHIHDKENDKLLIAHRVVMR